jgi:hypothetical protein
MNYNNPTRVDQTSETNHSLHTFKYLEALGNPIVIIKEDAKPLESLESGGGELLCFPKFSLFLVSKRDNSVYSKAPFPKSGGGVPHSKTSLLLKALLSTSH